MLHSEPGAALIGCAIVPVMIIVACAWLWWQERRRR